MKRLVTKKLKLKVNESKSAVAKPQQRKFPGFSFAIREEPKRIIAPKRSTFKDSVPSQMGALNSWVQGRSA